MKFLCINHGHWWLSNHCLLLVLLGLLRFVETIFVIFYFKFQGYFKEQEDKKHRATYQALGDSEKKLQFFSARQIACRLLGSRGYLCQKVFVCCIESLQYFAGCYFPFSLIIWLVAWHFWGPRCVWYISEEDKMHFHSFKIVSYFHNYAVLASFWRLYVF